MFANYILHILNFLNHGFILSYQYFSFRVQFSEVLALL